MYIGYETSFVKQKKNFLLSSIDDCFLVNGIIVRNLISSPSDFRMGTRVQLYSYRKIKKMPPKIVTQWTRVLGRFNITKHIYSNNAMTF